MLNKDIHRSGWDGRLAAIMMREEAKNKPIARASRAHMLRELKRWLPDQATPVLMEAGCSSGANLEAVRGIYPRARLIGADFDAAVVEKAAARLSGIETRQLDLSRDILPANSIDGFIMLNVLEHIEDDGKALQCVCHALKPGGVVVLEVPAGPGLYDVFDKKVGHFRRYAMTDLVKRLASAGFEVVSRSHAGFLVYPIFYSRKKKNRRLKDLTESQQWEIIEQVFKGGGHPLLMTVFRIEAFLRTFFPLPCGIRCLVTGRKPGGKQA